MFDAMLALYGFGVQVAYLNFVGQFASSLSEVIAPHIAPLSDRVTWIWLALIVAIPLSTPKNLSALKYCSIVAAVSLTYTAVLIVAKSPYHFAGIANLEVVSFNWSFFTALGNFIFAFNCHLNVSPVAGELLQPTLPRMRKIARISVPIQLVFYLMISVCGYLSFGKNTNSDILANYDSQDVEAIIARICLGFTLLIALPINLVPTIRCFLRVVERLFCRSAEREQELLNPMDPGGMENNEGTTSKSLHDRTFVRLCVAVLYLVCAAAVAVVVPDPAAVIGLISAAIGTMMMLILPAFIAGQMSGRVIFLLIFGFTNGLGAFVMLLQDVQVVPSKSIFDQDTTKMSWPADAIGIDNNTLWRDTRNTS